MTWNIKAKLLTLGLIMLLLLLVIVIQQLSTISMVEQSAQMNQQRQNQYETITDIHFKQQRLLLVAMDAIVDRQHGAVAPERRSQVEELVQILNASVTTLRTLADTREEQMYVERYATDLELLIRLVQVDLFKAIDGQAKEGEFARLDDEIDAQGEKVAAHITALKTSVSKERQNAISAEREEVEQAGFSSKLLFLVATLLFVPSLFWITRGISVPLVGMTEAMRLLAQNKLDTEIPAIGQRDEIGAMADAVHVFKQNMILNEQLAAEKALEQQIKEEQRRHLEHSTNLINGVMQRVSSGDLTQRVNINGAADDVMVVLGENLNKMIMGLAAITQQIREGSSAIASTLSEVRSALSAQSSGASETAAAVSETSATLQEIKATSNQTMDKATHLGQVSEQSRVESERGQQAVSNAVNGMSLIKLKVEAIASEILELSKKSQQIGEITSVVETLAQQSKMLALNASIEAAKAGEAGQGFAVVAEEIRNLANQSSESTAQVRGILQDIKASAERTVMVTEEGTKQVDVGMQLVESAGLTMKNLDDVVAMTATGSQQIVAVVRQEAAGIDQITTAVTDISAATTNAVSAVRQSEVAVNEMQTIVERLKERVSIYQL